jgi:LmbE family N-acetylglucosaminyl deacetylase
MRIEGPVLVIVAHADDEVIGCGGTIAKLAASGVEVHTIILADGESSRDDPKVDQAVELRSALAQGCGEILGSTSTTSFALPDNRLDTLPLLDVVKLIEKEIGKRRPKTIISHRLGDVNVDHQVVHEAVLAATRPQPGNLLKMVLFFDISSSTEWRFTGSQAVFLPNYFVDISNHWTTKELGLGVYANEMRAAPHPRSIKVIDAKSVVRGSQIGVARAEGFELGWCIFT